jgi:acyl carrier protein
MSSSSRNDVCKFVTDFLNQKLTKQRRDLLGDVGDDYDLFQSGIIDSLGFVELITAVGERFGLQIDLEGLDAEKMTILGPLCAYLSGELKLHCVS